MLGQTLEGQGTPDRVNPDGSKEIEQEVQHSKFLDDAGPKGAHNNRMYRGRGGNVSLRPKSEFADANKTKPLHISLLQKSRKKNK